MLSLALLTTSSLTSALFLPVVTMLLVASPKSGLTHPQPFSAPFMRTVPILLRYTVYLLALVGISTLIVGDLSWVSRTWGATLTLPDVTPNPGLWWYFFTEMFDHFRPFFLMTFSMHLLIYVAPICLKFQCVDLPVLRTQRIDTDTDTTRYSRLSCCRASLPRSRHIPRWPTQGSSSTA